MAVKILLLVMLVIAAEEGAASTCKTRSAVRDIHKLIAGSKCKPQEYPVQIPVPEGYDYVYPNVARINQCTGMSCRFPDKCLPDPDNITVKKLKVHAYRLNDRTPHCEEVEVEEHGACNCRCERATCSRNQLFNDQTCECECNPAKKVQCEEERSAGLRVMWSESTCTCTCDHPTPCDWSMVWVEDLCRCVYKDNLDYIYSNEV